jgi:hypothetical protein
MTVKEALSVTCNTYISFRGEYVSWSDESEFKQILECEVSVIYAREGHVIIVPVAPYD